MRTRNPTAQLKKQPDLALKEVILVIDHDLKKRAFYESTFEKKAKRNMEFLTSGEDALKRLSDPDAFQKYAIVILDWHLTDMPAFVFIQKIRANIKLNNLDFLVVTRLISSDDLVLLSELEIGQRIQHGENSAEFITRVDEILRFKQDIDPAFLEMLNTFKMALEEENLSLCQHIMQTQADLESFLWKSPKYVHLLGSYYILKKDLEGAIYLLQGAYEQLTNKDYGMRILNMLARAQCFAGKFDEAAVNYEKLSKKSPKNHDHKVGLGDARLGQDKIEEAKEIYEQVLGEDKGNKPAMVGLGKIAVAEGDYKEAYSIFANIKGKFENLSLASFFNNRGVALSKIGKPEEAILLYKNAVRFLKKYRAQVQFNMGLAYAKIGKTDLAKKTFNHVLETADLGFIEKKSILKKLNEGRSTSEEFFGEFDPDEEKF